MAKAAEAKAAGKATEAKATGLYDVHPGVAMVQKWIAGLKGKTGRSLEEWIALAMKEGPKDAKARLAWLKTKHGFGTNNARWIAERVDGKNGEEESPEEYLKSAAAFVREQYAGPKEKLRPIYDELLAVGKAMGADVKACPCQTMVPLYREHVFAQIKPTTNTRIDMGFALAKHKGKLPKRLIDTGGLAKKDRITHRIELKSAGEIDEEVKKWMKVAYDLDEAKK
jgi:hypothetical protein